MIPIRSLAASLLVLPLALGTVAAAQDYDRPPAGYDDGAPMDRGTDYGRTGPVDTPDAASLSVRVSKLEGRIREITGQLEELQNNNRKLVEQLQKFQADVDARLTSAAPRQRRSEAEGPAVIAAPAVVPGATQPAKTRAARDDAFDPDKAGVTAPGKPKPLGSASSAQPDDVAGAPMDLAGGKLRNDAGSDTIAPTLRLPSATPKVGVPAVATTPGGTVIASTGTAATSTPATPRAEYEAALSLFKDKQYEGAEKGFTEFLQKNPKNRYAVDATFYLGESYAKRGRTREAAEQYLKISTDFANTPRAPDAMLHLGMSLKALGAKEQACATFSAVTEKYPSAPDYVKAGAEREAKRSQC